MPRKKLEKVEYEDGKLYSLEAGTPIYVKTADICRMTGKSNQWIGQLTSQGVLTKEKTKYGSLYELSAAMPAYCHMLEERAEDDGVLGYLVKSAVENREKIRGSAEDAENGSNGAIDEVQGDDFLQP